MKHGRYSSSTSRYILRTHQRASRNPKAHYKVVLAEAEIKIFFPVVQITQAGLYELG